MGRRCNDSVACSRPATHSPPSLLGSPEVGLLGSYGLKSMRASVSFGILSAAVVVGALLRSIVVDLSDDRAGDRGQQSAFPSPQLTDISKTQSADRADKSCEDLFRRVEALEAQLQAQKVLEPLIDAGPIRAALSKDAIAELAEQQKQELVAVRERFLREATDPVWSALQETKITSGLQERVNNKRISATSSVECKSTICFATLTWPNLGSAQMELKEGVIPDDSCTRQMTLPSDSPATGPVSADLVFICDR